ncbi:MAG: FAD:protein FMN transferase [Spirochaetaceae bacterium]|nr:FAD:protein FMN transferase [Spirochaetaceae bacterium]
MSVLLILPLITGCAKEIPIQTEFVLGTVCTVQLYHYGSAKIYNAVFSRVREIENRMSVVIPDTDIARINRNAGIEPVPVHQEVITLLERSRYYAELSGGAFDPTVGPLVKLWDITSEHPRLPSAEAIQEALALIDWRDVIINREAETVFLRRIGMALDLGAIAKGYAADEAIKIIKQAGIPRGIIDFGGNIFAYGEKASPKSPWRIGVQHPLGGRGSYIGILEVSNKSVVTSGVYERYAEIDGVRYHHILSTADGYPVHNGLLSVTIIADASVDADALSTAVFALGYEQGKALVESLGTADAVFIFADTAIRFSQGAEALFKETSASRFPEK